jgi:ApeA N-terminal domain 1
MRPTKNHFFDSMSFHVEGLDEWHCISGIKAEFPDRVKGTTITYTPLEKIQLWAGDGYVLTLKFSWTAPSLPTGAQATIRQKSYLHIASDKLRPLDDFDLVAGNMRNLICFAVDENVSIHDIEARSSLILDPTTSDEKRQQGVQVVAESIRFQKTPPNAECAPPNSAPA